jgi:hypothetical protein
MDPERETTRPRARPAARRWMAIGGAALFAYLLGACGGAQSEPTIGGEIDDDEIRVERGSGPPIIWLELENVGTQPCAFVPLLASMPTESLPVSDGEVIIDMSGDPNIPYPMEAHVELNGEPAGGLTSDEDWTTVVNPGDTIRLQLALKGAPDEEERVVICNELGGYEAGRYAVIAFEP